MMARLLLAAIAAAPGRAPPSGAEPPHAQVEEALLRTAYPGYQPEQGWLGHSEGFLVGRSSICLEGGTCLLAVAATANRPGGEAVGGHSWSSFFALRPAGAGWVEAGYSAGPVISAAARWRLGVSILVDGDGPFLVVTTSTSGGEDGESSATHLWTWDGAKFLPVLTAATTLQGTAVSESSFALCADRPQDRPSWELRTREREGTGKWTESKVRVRWNGQAWVERAGDRPCGDRSGSVAVASATPAAARGQAAVRVKAASASRTAAAPKGRPGATAAANAVDGDGKTAWEAGGKKGGVGEWLQLDLASSVGIGSLQLVGTCPGPDWKAGPRLKKIRLRFEDGPAQEETLADIPTAQSIAVKRTGPARWIRVELLEVFGGSGRRNACVTEATLQAR